MTNRSVAGRGGEGLGSDTEHRERSGDGDGHGVDPERGRAGRGQAAFRARRQRAPGAGAASRYRQPRTTRILRCAGAPVRRHRPASSGLRQIRAPAMAAQRARRRGHLSMAAVRSRHRAAGLGRARLWRVDRRRDGDDGARRAAPAGAGRRDGLEAARGRHLRPGDRQLPRLCPRRVSRPGGVRPHLRRGVDRPAGRVGHLPRDVLPDRLEALHVQPDPAASPGRGAGAGAGGVGRRRQDRAEERRRALCRGLAQGAVRDRARQPGIASTWSSPRRWRGWSAASSPRIEAHARRLSAAPGNGNRRNPCM